MENGREMNTSRNAGFPKEKKKYMLFFLVPKHRVWGGNNTPIQTYIIYALSM